MLSIDFEQYQTQYYSSEMNTLLLKNHNSEDVMLQKLEPHAKRLMQQPETILKKWAMESIIRTVRVMALD